MTKNSYRRTTEAELSAYHEAGHVVMAYLLKRQFRYATIDPSEIDKEINGCTFLEPIKTLSLEGVLDYSFKRIQNSIEREVKIALAGEVAEALLLGRNDWVSAKKDIQRCYELYDFLCVNIDQFKDYIKRLWLSVRDILKLPCNWFCIQGVVQALLKHGRISYRKARAVIRKAKASYYRSLSNNRQRQSFFKRLKFTVFYKLTKTK